MRVLAIETVEKSGSVAAMEDGELRAELLLNDGRRSLETLAPAIQQLLAGVGWRPRDVQLVAAVTGPGSFTGLRIGVATAKTFAYAAGCEALGVGTMPVLAAQVPLEMRRFEVVVDAQREELFVARFERDAAGEIVEQTQPRIEPAAAWLGRLESGAVVSGPGLKRWIGRLPAGVLAVGEERWEPRAVTAGRLASLAFQRGERQALVALVPQYFRETAAEEQWQRKHGR